MDTVSEARSLEEALVPQRTPACHKLPQVPRQQGKGQDNERHVAHPERTMGIWSRQPLNEAARNTFWPRPHASRACESPNLPRSRTAMCPSEDHRNALESHGNVTACYGFPPVLSALLFFDKGKALRRFRWQFEDF